MSSPQKPKTRRRIAERLRCLCGAVNTHREKVLRQAEIYRGNSFPEGEIIAIVNAIELGFIGIIIIIITIATSTFITLITTPSRCNILG
jgi:hypothetical protein